ncbi:MAG TPA: UDP-N-acetylmuramate dehydrogenase [Myxococcales bacterium]|nr:UDP-N-acetylmuramate dehydrogenase [Myxococcales bacterium]
MTPAQALKLAVRGAVLENEPLEALTSIRLGGPARTLFRPIDTDDLVAGLRVLRAEAVPHLVLGGGANTLVGDRGVSEVVVQLGAGFASEEWPAEHEVALGAGVPGMRALRAARKKALVGPEFLVGIPGTLGGQVAMNAGTKQGQLSDILVAAEVATAEGAGWVPAADLRYAYRESHLPVGGVVTRARLRLARGDVAAGDAAVKADLDYRRGSQPWSQPNLGSTFKNPPGDKAGRLLEAVGLKGHRVGGVAFSDQHANFLVNLAQGKAADALALIELGKARVREQFGIALELEVVLLGEFA